MKSSSTCVLTINGGSSSIRFAIYDIGRTLRPLLSGKIDGIGSSNTTLTTRTADRRPLVVSHVAGAGGATPHRAAVKVLLDWLEGQPLFAFVRAIGHRVVHGRRHPAARRITPGLLAELRRSTAYDPEHLPRELGLVEAFSRRQPALPQVACFDTAFHRGMPRVAKLFPLPRRYARAGVERYGFHGISYSYLMEELDRIDPVAVKGRVILAHLGSGASLAAVRDGKSVDTSMGFSPASGLVMGTRAGDLDPGLVYYLARTEGMTAAQFQTMINHRSGLRGVSGTSADVRDLLAREPHDSRAAEAVALFCYQVKKWIGSFAAALGGLETLVFAGGIGENAPVIRARVCDGLGFLGVALDRRRNAGNAPIVSARDGRVKVRVIRTNEELMIARSVARVLGWAQAEEG